ncbi:MAG: tail fiber domain-containing protein [Candidatus Peribacteraceae bacterium]|nr:tail fiber domain-containing protein [Candidatus Peribacteraceae bacterium]
MPDVTVSRLFIDKDFYGTLNAPVYAYSRPTGGGATTDKGITWLGGVAYAIGTYVDADTIQANPGLLFDGSALYAGTAGIDIGGGSLGTRFADISREADGALSHTQIVHSNTGGIGNRGDIVYRSGGTGGSPTAAPTNAVIQKDTYYIYDGSSYEVGAEIIVEVDGVVAVGDFSTNISWALKDGAAATAIVMSLYPSGLHVDTISELTTDAGVTIEDINFEGNAMILTGGGYITEDSAGAMIFEDGVGGPYELAELVGGGLWQEGNDSTYGSYLTPVNAATDIILIGGGTERLIFQESGYDDSYVFMDNGGMYFGTQTAFNFNAPIFLSSADYIYGHASATIGNNSAYWNAVYSNTYYVANSSTYISVESDTEMSFTDPINGTVKLGDIGAHGNHTGQVTSVGLGTTLAIAAISNQDELTSGLVSSDKFLVLTSLGLHKMDVSVLQTYMQDNLSFGGGAWGVSSNLITPTTGGDDVRLVNGEQLQFGDANNYIEATSTPGYIEIRTGSGALNVRFGGGAAFFSMPIQRSSSAGNLNIGSTSYPFNVTHVNDLYIYSLNTTAGDYYLTWDSTTKQVRRGASTSDIRLKQNINTIGNAVERIKMLDGFTYRLNEQGQKETGKGGSLRAGVSAQDVQAVLPEAVGRLGQTEFLRVDYDGLIALLINAAKEQQIEIDELKKKIQ